MNPMLFMDIDLAFFKSFFGSKEDDKEENKSKDKDKKEKNKKEDIKKSEINLEKNKNESNEIIQNKPKLKNEKEKAKEKSEDNNTNQIIIDEALDKEKQKEKEKENNNIIINEEIKKPKKEINKKNKNLKIKKNEKKTKDELIKFLIEYIKKVFLFRLNVKKIIQRQKENYSIVSSINTCDLTMEIYLAEDKTQKVKYTFEPILKENIFYIPKRLLKKKNLMKFTFLNKKKENIIDPKFNTEYDCGEFINVINLKKIKDKEEEREEDFQAFLESYYTLKQAQSKETTNINKFKLEAIRTKKKHRTMDSKNGLLFGVNKVPSNSILKQRGEHRRITSNKKISFSDKNETIAYKKDE
jgi:hypothetical protein